MYNDRNENDKTELSMTSDKRKQIEKNVSRRQSHMVTQGSLTQILATQHHLSV